MAEFEFPEWYKQIDLEDEKRDAEAAKRDAEAKQTTDELKKTIKSMSEEINGIAKSNGMVAEEMIFNSLNKNRTFANIRFDDIERNVKLKSKMLNLQGEYDIVLTNGDTIAIIEAKWRVRPEDITKLTTKQVTNFRNIFTMFADYKIMLGIGGMAFEDNSEEDAREKGVGIIKVLTDSVEYYTDSIKMY
jgi:N-acetylglutamate synthase/N-acetylornithine aminotransferase